MYTKQDLGTLSRNFVRQMAKQFEQISSVDSTSYSSEHEANFKQCNWWLDNMPSLAVTCFDDLPNDSQQQSDNDCLAPFDIAGERPAHQQQQQLHDIDETAEIANEVNEFQNNVSASCTETDHNATFFRHIDQCLSFPPSKSTKIG